MGSCQLPSSPRSWLGTTRVQGWSLSASFQCVLRAHRALAMPALGCGPSEDEPGLGMMWVRMYALGTHAGYVGLTEIQRVAGVDRRVKDIPGQGDST